MLSPLLTPKPLFLAHSKMFAKSAITALLSLGLTVSGCDNSTSGTTSKPPVQIFANSVILDSNYIQTSIPEQYQPSFNLEGALVPAEVVKVTTDLPVFSSISLVKLKQWVEKGEVVLEINTQLPQVEAISLADEFTDVYIDGEQVGNDSVQTQLLENNLGAILDIETEDKDADDKDSTGTVAAATTQQSETTSQTSAQADNNLVPVTLVFKAPISGEVTKIANISAPAPSTQTSTPSTESTSTPTTQGSTQSPPQSSTQKSEQTALVTATTKEEIEKPVEYQQPASKPPIVELTDTNHLQLIGKLPLATQSKLDIGRSVDITVYDTKSKLDGQISHLIANEEEGTLTLKALVLTDDETALLKPGMMAAMTIEYGQKGLGVRLPRRGIKEASLTEFDNTHPRPTSPVKGYVWVIEQDHTLSYTPVEVVEYFSETDQFLVGGINNDSLVCLADLPESAAGKIVRVD